MRSNGRFDTSTRLMTTVTKKIVSEHNLRKWRNWKSDETASRHETCASPWQASMSAVKVSNGQTQKFWMPTCWLLCGRWWQEKVRTWSQLLDRCVRFNLISLTLDPDVSRSTWKDWTNLSTPVTDVNRKGSRDLTLSEVCTVAIVCLGQRGGK